MYPDDKLNPKYSDEFLHVKPVCEVIMVCPSEESLAAFTSRIKDLKKGAVQHLQIYLLFPLMKHLKTPQTEKNHGLRQKLIDAMRTVLEKVVVKSPELWHKIEIGLLDVVFDQSMSNWITDIPEELKLSVISCLTVLILNINTQLRLKILQTQVPLMGKAIYVAVQLAKTEKLRALRIASIKCVTAHTMGHARLTSEYSITDPLEERLTVDMLALILPGVLAALQDVATCSENPGHVAVVTAIDALHRITCLTMNNKFVTRSVDVTTEDFAKLVIEKDNREVSSKDKDPKKLPARSPEWYSAAGEKLMLVTKSIASLRTHEHFKVRKELAVYCSRLLFECNIAMESSVPLVLDTLILLTKDEYPEVAEYCTNAIDTYFQTTTEESKLKTLDALCDNFFNFMNLLPRIMNNIDSNRKMASLNLLHGYVTVLCATHSPQRLMSALSIQHNVQSVCVAFTDAVAMVPDLTMLTHQSHTDVTAPPPAGSPWCKFRHLDSIEQERRMQDVLVRLGEAQCASLLLDYLFELFAMDRVCELAFIFNWMAAGQNSSADVVNRILNAYIQEDVWYLPLEITSTEPALTEQETMDVSVYNPRSWDKDSVPDLYEGAMETRYTDISYQTPRVEPAPDPNSCSTLGQAQRNMLMSCLLTEGVGMMANRLKDMYQPYLLSTLCLVLERVGSKYEMLHLAGLKALHNIAHACGHSCAADLIKQNADYFTHQITVRLKKAWNCQSALQILSVVMEYSDSSIMNYFYGIVQDVLVQSCDKYYEKDLHAYLQVFLTFLDCIRKWYTVPEAAPKTSTQSETIDVMRELALFIDNTQEAERLLNEKEFEQESGISVEEMYREDVRRKEEDVLDYDDTVSEQKSPPPQYLEVTVTILKRCLNYVVTSHRDNSILALQVLTRGLPILRDYEDVLLPLVHLAWRPLVTRFEAEPLVMKRAFELLVTMADLAKDFIRNRAVTDVLPHIFAFLHKSSKDSYLKDVGSAYRSSQAYSLQLTALAALPRLATDLILVDEPLELAMYAVRPYLSKKQPKALQASAVEFFKTILEHDYGAAWYHLRELCDNEEVLPPPTTNLVHLLPVIGTPYLPTDKDYENNVKTIFSYTVS